MKLLALPKNGRLYLRRTEHSSWLFYSLGNAAMRRLTLKKRGQFVDTLSSRYAIPLRFDMATTFALSVTAAPTSTIGHELGVWRGSVASTVRLPADWLFDGGAKKPAF